MAVWGPNSCEYIVNGIVLGALAVMWIAVLSWEGIQSLRDGMGRRGSSMVVFRRQLDLLSRQPHQLSAANRLEFDAGGARVRRSPRYTPSSRFEAARRRRDTVYGLGSATAVGIVGLYLTGMTPAMYLLVIAAMLFVSYCALVIRRRQIIADHEAKVRYLPSAARAEQPPALLRRRAN